MHGSTTIDVNQMQSQGKKRRMDWDSLDLNENGGGSGSIGIAEKMPNMATNGKDCERNRAKNVNGGELNQFVCEYFFEISIKFTANIPWLSISMTFRSYVHRHL